MDIKFILMGLLFLIIIPLPNWLRVRENNKQLAHWNKWLTNLDSHESYLLKHPDSNNEVHCFFCANTKTLTQVTARLAKKVEWGFFNNQESKEYIHYVSYYCSRCNSELFRHSHEV